MLVYSWHFGTVACNTSSYPLLEKPSSILDQCRWRLMYLLGINLLCCYSFQFIFQGLSSGLMCLGCFLKDPKPLCSMRSSASSGYAGAPLTMHQKPRWSLLAHRGAQFEQGGGEAGPQIAPEGFSKSLPNDTYCSWLSGYALRRWLLQLSLVFFAVLEVVGSNLVSHGDTTAQQNPFRASNQPLQDQKFHSLLFVFMFSP